MHRQFPYDPQDWKEADLIPDIASLILCVGGGWKIIFARLHREDFFEMHAK